MQKKSRLDFPKRFLWGAATSAHQSEGGTHNQWTVWELENAKSKAAQAKFQLEDLESWPRIREEAEDPTNYVSAINGDHYTTYKEDFDFLEQMNMNAFRFSVEWSRIEPTEGAWDVEAINHYKEYVAELKRRNIEPVLVLFHFTLPVWFAQKGGFEKRRNVQYFVRYAAKVLQELGSDIKFILTLNEPDLYAAESYWLGEWPPNYQASKWKFWRVLNNLAHAHSEVAKHAHATSRRYKVAVAKNSAYFYAGDDAWLSRKSAAVFQYFHDDYFMRKVAKYSDFIGLNFYLSNRVYGYRVRNPEYKVSDIGWDLSPADIQHAMGRLGEKYKLPLMITENGLADGEDQHRQWWLTQTLSGMQKAMENGVELWGYLHWSLIDNFERDKGFWPRFGLVYVDYKTGKRMLRESGKWFGKVIKHLSK